MLERAKAMPFRTKQANKDAGSSSKYTTSKIGNIPNSSSKQPSMCSKIEQKHFISAQKSGNGKVKLFAERRASNQNMHLSNKMSE